MLHGVLLITLFSCAAFYIGDMGFVKSISFSPMIVGIILGMLYANSLRNNLPDTWVPGINFCSKRVLRIGIILYGFKLTFQDVTAVGLPAICVDALIVTVTICGGILIGRLLRMDRGIALLTSVGSGICGAAAILGAESAIKIKPYKTAVAVATVVIFGTLSMFLYPILYRSGVFALSPEAMGIFTGSTIHEVAHVVGAGNAMGKAVSDTAIIVKMIRVMMLVPVLLVISYSVARAALKNKTEDATSRPSHTDTLVCHSLPGRHRFQLVQPVAAGRGVVHQHPRHLPPHHGHDGSWCRDEHREIQEGRFQAVPSCAYSLRLAHRRRLCHCQISRPGVAITWQRKKQSRLFSSSE
jgi:uncharacterized integral membrane protein (TIGR00698 family)